MIHKILIASDLTDASMPALRTGLDMARRLAAEVTVLHVMEPAWEQHRWFEPFSEHEKEFLLALGDKQRIAAERLLAEQIKKARASAGGEVALHQLVKPGVPVPTIIETAREQHANLVVVGTHGRTGISHMLLGSIAEHVVRESNCPVLTVHAES